MKMNPFTPGRVARLFLLMLLAFLSACEEDDTNLPVLPEDEVLGDPNSIYNVADANSELTTFISAVNNAGLTLALREDDGNKTVFAPSNSAFQAAGIDLNNVDPAVLQSILRYHVVADSLPASAITSGRYTTITNKNIEITANGNVVIDPNGDNATVVTADLGASNGVIHIIDKVLTPQPTLLELVQGNSNLSVLGEALGRFDDLAGAAGNEESFLTVFAPTNAAFTALLDALPEYSSLSDIPDHVLKTILEYHLVAGKALSTELAGQEVTTLQDENIVADNVLPEVNTADINASNGVAHVVSEVLIPPAAVGEVVATNSVYRFLLLDPEARFTELVTAIDNAGLRQTLLGDGTFTVFAPSNTSLAEASLGAGDLTENILLYHVLGSVVTSDMLSDGAVETLAPDENEIFVKLLPDGTPTINVETNVTDADNTTANGVVHAISSPLLPLQNVVTIASNNDNFSELVAALTRAELVDDVQNLENITVFAPDNAAFQALYQNLGVSGVDEIEVADLRNILLGHIFGASRVFSVDIQEGENTLASGGDSFTIYKEGSQVAINQLNGLDANLTGFDILGSNGIIHAIDRVLLP